MKMRTAKYFVLASLLVMMICSAQPLLAQESVISYQGQLRQAGEPFNGTANLQFRLFGQLSGGSQIASPVTLSNWPIEEGLFQVELDFGAAAFDGSERFLQVRVDGSPLSPRQKITATPYALFAGEVAPGAVDSGAIDPAQVQLRVTGTCPNGRYVRVIGQDGSVTCGIDDAGEPGWSLAGNAGTDPSTDFIGTIDVTALELRTANARSLRIEPSALNFGGLPNTVNMIAGSAANEVADGVRGASISGGGSPAGESDPVAGNEAPNRINDHYGVIGGGLRNTIGDPASPDDNPFATIGGGQRNEATGIGSTIGGGSGNTASSSSSTIGGGLGNVTDGMFSVISGGQNNTATGDESKIGGGVFNQASGQASSVIGGSNNTASGFRSSVVGGHDNCAGGRSSWAGGNRAKVRPGSNAGDPGRGCEDIPESGDSGGDRGTFVWADSQAEDFISSAPDQFLVRAQGGIGFGRIPSDHFEIQAPFAAESGDGTGTAGALRIRLDGATKLRLMANGGLGIGSSFSSSGVPENGLRVNGVVRIGALGSAGTTQLCSNSGGEIAGCSSSARYKGDITPLNLGLDTLLSLRPVGYRWVSDGSEDIGFVAEEVAEIDERLVTRNAQGEIEGVRYDRISAVLANAAQEMNERDQRVQVEFQQLQSENHLLRSRLSQLETRQATELASLREELATMRELIAPRLAQEAQ